MPVRLNRLLGATQPIQNQSDQPSWPDGIIRDPADRDDGIKDLRQRKIATDRSRSAGNCIERLCGSHDPRSAFVHYGRSTMRVGQKQRCKSALPRSCEVELLQPEEECLAPIRGSFDDLRCGAYLADLLPVKFLDQIEPARKVTIQRRHSDTRAPRDLGHGRVYVRLVHGFACRLDDAKPVPFRVGPPSLRGLDTLHRLLRLGLAYGNA